MLFGPEHTKQYQETGGKVGHDWEGSIVLLLTTTGRRSGEKRIAPLIYQEHGDDYLIVASKGGADEPPAWFLNLEAEPKVELQVWDDVFPATARVATANERAEMWPKMVATWPAYDDYQAKTDREIPIVVLSRSS